MKNATSQSSVVVRAVEEWERFSPDLGCLVRPYIELFDGLRARRLCLMNCCVENMDGYMTSAGWTRVPIQLATCLLPAFVIAICRIALSQAAWHQKWFEHELLLGVWDGTSWWPQANVSCWNWRVCECLEDLLHPKSRPMVTHPSHVWWWVQVEYSVFRFCTDCWSLLEEMH